MTVPTVGPDVITPSANSPAAAPKPAAAAPPPAAAPPVKTSTEIELDNTKQALERTKAELAKKTKEGITNRRATEEKVKTMGARLSLADGFEKFQREVKVNPLKALQPFLGEKAYERIVEAQLGGGAASAEAMALEIDKVKEDFKAELAKRDEADKAKSEAARAEQAKGALAATRRQMVGEADAFIKASGTDYPIAVDNFGARLPQVLAQRIEAHFAATYKEDEAGNVVQAGVVQTPQQALESLENDLAALVEKGLSAAKYADRWRTKLTPAPASGGNAPVVKPSGSAVTQQQSQRSVNNGLTATTNNQRPERRTDVERRAAAERKFEESRSQKAQ